MSTSTFPEKTPFEKAYSQFTLPKINSIEHIELPGNPPGFIHKKKVNGQDLFFLGEDLKDNKQLEGHYYRVDRMVIPQYSRMVNPDRLGAALKKGKEDDSIDVDRHDDLFYEGKLNSNVLLDVVGMITPVTYENMHFHACDNHDPEKRNQFRGQNFSHATNRSGQCHSSHIGCSFDDVGRRLHKIILFYIKMEDMDKSWSEFKEEHPDTPFDSVTEFLKLYFTDEHYNNPDTFKDNNPDIEDWDRLNIEGVFLLPAVMAGNQVMYQCLLNIKGKSNTNIPIKKTLKTWLNKMDQLNDPTGQDMVLEIGDNDFVNMWLEPWSVFIAKNFDPIVCPAKDLYKESVLLNKLM